MLCFASLWDVGWPGLVGRGSRNPRDCPQWTPVPRRRAHGPATWSCQKPMAKTGRYSLAPGSHLTFVLGRTELAQVWPREGWLCWAVVMATRRCSSCSSVARKDLDLWVLQTHCSFGSAGARMGWSSLAIGTNLSLCLCLNLNLDALLSGRGGTRLWLLMWWKDRLETSWPATGCSVCEMENVSLRRVRAVLIVGWDSVRPDHSNRMSEVSLFARTMSLTMFLRFLLVG